MGANVISVAAITGIISVLFAFLLGAARVWFAVSRDGLLPRWFAHPHPRFRTLYRPTAILAAPGRSYGAASAHPWCPSCRSLA